MTTVEFRVLVVVQSYNGLCFLCRLNSFTIRALVGGEKALTNIVVATHSGTTTEEFEKIVQDRIVTAQHPASCIPRLFTSRCSNCSRICEQTDSRPLS